MSLTPDLQAGAPDGRLEVTAQQLGEAAEFRTRPLSATLLQLVRLLGVAMATFHIVVLGFYPIDPLQMYAVHLMFASAFAFLLIPGRKKGSRTPTWWDWALVATSVAVVAYLLLYFHDITWRAGVMPTRFDVIAGVALIVVVVEAVRRATGWAMPILAALFVLYTFIGPQLPGMLRHGGFDFATVVSFLFSSNGIYSVPIAASARFVYLFILFGAFIEVSGIGRFIVNLGLSVAGYRRGGPAKVSILTSALFGTASGSSAANVMVDGVINVPLMKSTGFRAPVAGAIEAMNSTGGQMLPPVMGAAAFLMADILGLPYSQIAVSAILPAVLYYLAAYWMIDLYAVRNKLHGLPRERLPSLRQVMFRHGYLIFPLALMLALIMVFDYSPFRAALWSLGATVLASWLSREGSSLGHPWLIAAAAAYAAATWLGLSVLWSLGVFAAAVVLLYLLRPETRTGFRRIVDAMYDGSVRSVEIAATTACAGIIVGVLSLTGLGEKLSLAILALAGGALLPVLFTTMVVALVLGMGLPTTAAYAIGASTLAPALIELGIQPLAAHMFLFYFACLSALTPPVALASFAAASLARAPLWETAWLGTQFALAGFILPYMFVLEPALLMQGHWYEITWSFVTAGFGTLCLAGAVIGYLFRPASWADRGLLLVAALSLTAPWVATDAMGFALLGLVVVIQRLRLAPAAQAASK